MACFLENFGLRELFENPKIKAESFKYAVTHGTPVEGYNISYSFAALGNLKLWTACRRHKNGMLSTKRVNASATGCEPWDFVSMGIDISPKGFEPYESVSLLTRCDRANDKEIGVVPVEIIDSNTIADLSKGASLRLNIVGFPLNIAFYANEEELVEELSKAEGINGLLDDGALYPIGLQAAFGNDNSEYARREELFPAFVMFRGIVENTYSGPIEFGDFVNKPFFSTVIYTDFGRLRLIHTEEQVEPKYRENMLPGAVAYGVCVLSGDASTVKFGMRAKQNENGTEYFDWKIERGSLYSIDNDLMLLRGVMMGGDARKLETALKDDVVYKNINGKVIKGKEAVLFQLRDVANFYISNNIEYNVYRAMLLSPEKMKIIADNGGTATDIDGKKCLMIRVHESGDAPTCMTVQTDAEGKITNINTDNLKGECAIAFK